MNHFLGDPAFSVGDSVYTWGDVVLAAVQRGDWARLSGSLGRNLALLAAAEERGDEPTDEELDEAAQEFRYERDLITAEDMEAWLGREGITVDDWMDYVARTLVAAREGPVAGARRDEDGDGGESSDLPAPDRVATEAICSGALLRFAQTLAARVAIAARPDTVGAGTVPDADAIRSAARSASAEARRLGLGSLAGERGSERLEELVRAEIGFPVHSRALASASAVRNEIDSRRLDWVRLDLETLSFANEAAAREAALCVRDDGESFETVANSAHVDARRARVFADEIDAAARADLLSARPGEVVGPLAFADRFHLFRVHGKALPDETDEDVRRRAEAAVLARIVEEEIRTRVRWIERR